MSSQLSLSTTLKLAHGTGSMPQLGFGVYKSAREVCEKSIKRAIDVGYRHIDCAQYYLVGLAATTNPKVPRSELFLTTKTFNYKSGDTVDSLLPGLIESVKKMHPVKEGSGQQSYVDLFLIHTPTVGPEGRQVLWDAFQELIHSTRVKDGPAKHLEFSGVKHLENLKGETPAVLQSELHVFCQQRDVVDYCNEKGIVLQAYCPIVRNERSDDPTVVAIAKEVNKAPTQVMIRWCLQKGFSPLPKSDTPSRIAANADVYDFELSSDQMKRLDDLDEGPKGAVAPFNANCE